MDRSNALAQALFEYIPQADRDGFLHALIESLRLDDQSAVKVVTTLVMEHSSDAAKQDLLLLLETAIRNGGVDCAVSSSLHRPALGNELLSRTAKAVRNAKSTDGVPLDRKAVGLYLSFAKSVVSQLPCGDAHSDMLHVCLDSAQSEHLQHGSGIRDVLFALISTKDRKVKDTVIIPSLDRLWESICGLIASNEVKYRSLLGFSLWLRLVLFVQPEHYSRLVTSGYWQLLLNGLRKGDTEKRKLCLSILRTTTAADSSAVSTEERLQYTRYCTVFETIVLGRYVNQVQECEDDLDLLREDTSIPSQWLFTLLASALDPLMQESNRKFIGNWIMRSTWIMTPDFLDFFRHDFLPWATQGTLFVATLRPKNGQLRSRHGDRLSGFLRTLIASSDNSDELTVLVVEMIRRKRNSLFAYTLVYLLEGLWPSLRDNQKAEIRGISGLPEVARDYVAYRTAVSMNGTAPKLASKRDARELQAIERCKLFTPDMDDMEDLWSELDYLEHSKALVMMISPVILHPIIIERALQDQALADSVLSKLDVLRSIAHTRAYLFSPLLEAFRRAIFTNPNAVEILAIDDFIANVAEDPPVSSIDLMLEEATTYLTPFNYEHYFGQRPAYGFAALIDLVSRLGEHIPVTQSIVLRLVKKWKNQKVPPPTVSPWKTKLQLQVLLLCFEQYRPAAQEDLLELLEDVFYILAIEPLPQYRYLLEWMVIRMITRFQLQQMLLSRLGTKDHHSNPKHLASLMRIGVVLARDRNATEDFTVQLATSFVSLSASSKIVIRHEAQWQVPLLLDHARARHWKMVTGNPAFVALDEYIRSLERFHDPPWERQNARFDLESDHSITNLVEGRWLDLDVSEKPLTSHDEFVKLYANDSEHDFRLPESCMVLGERIERTVVVEVGEATTAPAQPAIGPRTADDVSALQTKGAAYLARTLSDHSLLDSRPNNLIVVGSLVDNPYNLGGLSRVSEIFGASALCLQNQNVVSNKDFTSVSVSSHLHFPIVQLSATALPDFLAERKNEGFTVVGIEQTDRSVILGSPDAILPEKVVLVVGSEKEGIPAIVLTECDVLVEIPQQGITRSLNVQTAVSIVLFEYTRQRRGS